MEIRVLRYFLEIARESSMSRAAETLHVSQPTLSKQMKELESELGKKLFHRGSTSVSLTDEGMLLRKRAEDILTMVDKTTSEFRELDNITGGEVHIGCAESRKVQPYRNTRDRHLGACNPKRPSAGRKKRDCFCRFNRSRPDLFRTGYEI